MVKPLVVMPFLDAFTPFLDAFMPFLDARTYAPDAFGNLRADIREDFEFRARRGPAVAAAENAKKAART
ncbi:hypothetical protein [Streptomyces cyaneofuscatus]|uniref:hypothetical protein n=1 Tax=Streptomyces cyaneofuscatus TaxID=66883 RepID=UPI00366561BE